VPREPYRGFFERYLGELPFPNGNGDVEVLCVFHQEDTPSLVINLEHGGFNCFGCNTKGDAYAFAIEVLDIDFRSAKKMVDIVVSNEEGNGSLNQYHFPGLIQESLVFQWHQALMNSTDLMDYLQGGKRGLNKETIQLFRLGWDGQRITIPIRNRYGQVVNVRRYDRHEADPSKKFLNYKQGYGTVRLFPRHMLQYPELVIAEGEWDAMLSIQMGIPTITQTGGAGTWKREWNEYFKDKVIAVTYDVDDAGRIGSQNVAGNLTSVAKAVHVVQLPLAEPPGADLTNYFLDGGQTQADFLELLRKTPVWTPAKQKAEPTVEPGPETVQKVPLELAREAQYTNKVITFDALCMGKDTSPYTVPKKVEWKCEVYGSRKICGGCSLGSNGQVTQNIGPTANVLDLIRVAKSNKQATLASWAGVAKCPMPSFTEIDTQVVEEVLFTEHVDAMTFSKTEESKHVVQNAFSIADKETIHTNRSYAVTGVGVPDPWQQKLTFIVQKATPLQDSVETYRMSPEMRERLNKHVAISEESVEAIEDRIATINADHSHNVTHIFGREDVHTIVDLTYHSVRGFMFERELIPRGWLDTLVIGDTRTGKSETASELVHHYGLGEVVLAEQASIAGIIGGLQQVGDKRFYLTWGKIPMNDSRLVVLDEVSGLEVEDLAQLSGIRSSGVAELTKIVSERTYARTRLLWLSNPRTGHALRTYSPGVKAVPELIGKSEDVARFDLAMAAATDEVDPAEIHRQRSRTDVPEHVYDSDLCKELILWVWSRKPGQVVFYPETITTIYKHALELGREYSSEIPLIEPASIHIKLARISAAVAGRVFSTDEGPGEQVVVKPVHVEFAVKFLNKVYSQPAFDYYSFSKSRRSQEEKAREKTPEVVEYIGLFPEVADLIQLNDMITAADIEEQLAMDRPVVKEHLAFFAKTRMITRVQGGYRKTPVLIDIFRKLRNGTS